MNLTEKQNQLIEQMVKLYKEIGRRTNALKELEIYIGDLEKGKIRYGLALANLGNDEIKAERDYHLYHKSLFAPLFSLQNPKKKRISEVRKEDLANERTILESCRNSLIEYISHWKRGYHFEKMELDQREILLHSLLDQAVKLEQFKTPEAFVTGYHAKDVSSNHLPQEVRRVPALPMPSQKTLGNYPKKQK